MFQSLRSRLVLTYILISGLVLTLVSVSLLFFLARNPLADRLVYQRLNSLADAIVQRDIKGTLGDNQQQLDAAVRRWDKALGVRLMFIGQAGQVLADSRPLQPLPPAEFLEEAARLQQPIQQAFRDVRGKPWLAAERRLDEDLVLIVSLPRPTLRSLAILGGEFLPPVLQAGAVALIISFLAAALISHWVATPLRRIAQASHRVADGDFSQRLPLVGPKEVQNLAQVFNHMVERVQASQDSQREFVANVSHELKTPLTSIQGFAQAIVDGTAQDSQSQRHAAQVIFDESNRLHRLVEDLLDLARIDAGQVAFAKEPVDLAALLRNVAEKLSVPAAAKNVRLQIELSPLPKFVGDGDRLAQVFTNLLDNAIKHTPGEGEVKLHGQVAEGWITIHVDDTGPGIAPDELPRIFERFYQVDKSRSGGKARGAGLGLSISNEIVRAHGGRIVAESQAGKGSRFSVLLPVAR